MSKKGFFAILILVLLLSIASFCIILFGVNPYKTSWHLFIFFYISIFIIIFCISSIIGLWLRIYFSSGKTNYMPTGTVLRQSFLIAIGVLGLLLLQAARILNWWDGILLILAVFLIDLYFKK